MKTAKPSPDTAALHAHESAQAVANPAAHDHDHAHGHSHAAGGASVESALAMAEAYCRERGEKLTPIRRKVLELLLASGRATKAYSLLDEMRQIHPGSAPPTVYRALDFLLSAGLIHRIESINAFAVCHDLTQCQHGILVVCQQCGNVTELHEPKLRQALVAQIEAAGYRLSGDGIELKGVCAQCQASEQASAEGAKAAAHS
ncbi:Fur family zinc uptake transcriptional regulator [Paraburkholderia eburnea]|uniref:Fur family zinc uptake transcriptional regulator n=1 Tax=Paraburkholderia eburnea TaxID=1189126 RepID=A0A2S4LZZ2_9BURK|nr:Fur family transcriptional regulator [Paraburkholderia eburnea]POR47909.1 Fur family zinc uptake transcriptional regulator [Paraburkholderia eburnea]PRZ19303.1 Fur family zinc uptake transcriptional regulator [Paraburkholderia eburnea]